MVVVVVMMKVMVTMMTVRLKFGNFLHKIRTVWDNLRNELDELNGASTVSVLKLIPISCISIKVLCSLSIRPSYGARGEEILDGGGGRGRRERKA